MARFFQVREGKRKANAECRTRACLCSLEKREKNVRIGSCLACVYRVMDQCTWKVWSREHERSVKADLDGTIFTYDCHVRPAHVMPSRQIVSCKLDPRHPYDTCGSRKLKLCACGWSIIMTYASRSRKS